MTERAIILADSIATGCQRVITAELYYPWMIHPEFMTHRTFSRNAASSRAIPILTFIDALRRDPAMPARWGLNGRGMQDKGEMSAKGQEEAKKIWFAAMESAINHAMLMYRLEEAPHKQIVNRLLLPFAHIRVVMTSTWDGLSNFLALRYHKDADPTIQSLATQLLHAIRASRPERLKHGEWHLPYITPEERAAAALAPPEMAEEAMRTLLRFSVARCARTSYRLHDGSTARPSDDLLLHDKLVGQVPLHASPAEHQVTPDRVFIGHASINDNKPKKVWAQPELHGNTPGWCQYRKTLPGEFITNFDLEAA